MAEIRRKKHLEYLRQTWLPTFANMYHGQFNKEKLVKQKLAKFIKKIYFPDVINKTPDELIYIPGIYRKRIALTGANLLMKSNELSKCIISKGSDTSVTNEDEIINQSLLEYQQNMEYKYEEDIQKAINESLINSNQCNKMESHLDNLDGLDGLDDLSKAIMMSLEDEYVNTGSDQMIVCIDLQPYLRLPPASDAAVPRQLKAACGAGAAVEAGNAQR